MKIYFIGQKGLPAISGGVETHVEELATRLVGLGHEVFAYTRPNYTDKNLSSYKGVNLISLPNIASKNLDAISHTLLACLDLIRRDVDIVHFHSIGPSSLIWLVKILKPGIPVISTFHTQCYKHKKWGLFARMYLKFGELMSCILADKTITISKSLTKYAKEKYRANADYIPNGVNIPSVKSAEIIKRWGLEKDNYIVSISRLVRHKGVHHLISAYNQVSTDKKLVIVGGSAYTDDYVKELKLLADGNKNIIFTGPQSGETIDELFSNAYLFVQPSESEGLSIALLEAMSYEKAVLVSDIPENLEVIEDAGFTFENKNIGDLTEKLSYLLRHPELVKSKESYGFDRVLRYYDWANIVNEIEMLYRIAVVKKKEVGIFSRFRKSHIL